jgi:hypothetical protein
VFIVFSLLISLFPLHLFFFVHVSNKTWVQEVGAQTNRAFAILVAPSQKKTTGDENKYEGGGYHFKMFIKEAFV